MTLLNYAKGIVLLSLKGSSLTTVLAERQKQVWFRLSMCLMMAGCYGKLLSWRATLLWVGAYAVLQLVELIAFDARSPWLGFFNRHAHIFGLSLLALNSCVFASFGLIQIDQIGIWGQAGAAYVLAGAILNTAVTTIGCRSAFYASVLPFAAYIGIFPVSALQSSNQPSSLVLIGITLSGTLMLLSAIRLWSKCTTARAAELAAVARDIAERQANERRLFRLAHFDSLTGLGNRNTLQDRLTGYVANNIPASLLMVDLDGFKYVNDTLGHSAGDEVLRIAGARIMDSARIDDLVVRLGGRRVRAIVNER